MGVIHKLREDIVSFIITLKKNNPSIGVRQLAVLTSEQFHITVSKSSVNSVLKKAALSSSVGRRSGSRGRPDKFSIPAIKKNQILNNIEKAGFLNKDVLLEDEISPIELKKAQIEQLLPRDEKPPLRPDPFNEEKSFLTEDSIDVRSAEKRPGKEALPAKETPENQDFIAGVEAWRREKASQGTPISDGCGFIFLKAAQWDLSQRPLMAELLTKHRPSSFSQRFIPVSELFVFLKFLGVESPDHILAYRGHGLWVFNGFGNPGTDENKDFAELQELFRWEKGLCNTPALSNLVMAYNRDKEQVFLEVKGFKLLLEDQAELAMDASMVSFRGGGPIPLFPCAALPVYKAMARLSNCLISNIQNAVFHRAPGASRLDRVFYDMVALFENIPGKRILQVVVFDWHDEEIARFTTVPFQKRTFLMGIGPHQKEFGEITKAVKWPGKKPFYHARTDQVVYFAETKTGIMAAQIHENIGDFRVITIWKNKENGPCWAILTNQKRGSGEDILKTYMDQWPYLEKSLDENPVLGLSREGRGQEAMNKGEENNGSSGIFSDFIGALHGYCQKYFFPEAYAKIGINHLITNIYGVPGVYWETGDSLSVLLDVEKGTMYRKDLEYSVRRVNERHIIDYSGRRLWLEI